MKFAGSAAWSTALVTVLCVSLLVAVAGAASASGMPRSVPMTAEFTGLTVGESASRYWDVTIPEPAEVATVHVEEVAPETGAWSATLCPAAGGPCVDLLTAARGTQLARGAYRLGIGVTILAAGTATTSIEGRLTFIERTGSLAMTGSGLLLGLLPIAVATLVLGLYLILASRRRREAHDPEGA